MQHFNTETKQIKSHCTNYRYGDDSPSPLPAPRSPPALHPPIFPQTDPFTDRFQSVYNTARMKLIIFSYYFPCASFWLTVSLSTLAGRPQNVSCSVTWNTVTSPWTVVQHCDVKSVYSAMGRYSCRMLQSVSVGRPRNFFFNPRSVAHSFYSSISYFIHSVVQFAFVHFEI